MTPRVKASVDVAGADGVAVGGGTGAVAAGVDAVALVSVTGTAADLCPLGTLAKNTYSRLALLLLHFLLKLLNY